MNSKTLEDWVSLARKLAVFTIVYNLLEAGACAYFGIQEDALSVLGFGTDSLLEATSGLIILVRFKTGADHSSGAAAERAAQKQIGVLFMLFAVGLLLASAVKWFKGFPTGSGLPGVVISLVSLAAMFWLYRAKMRVATALNSAVQRADAFATLSCMWMSGILLLGSLLLNASSMQWVDAATGLVIAVLIGREGWEQWEGEEEDNSETIS